MHVFINYLLKWKKKTQGLSFQRQHARIMEGTFHAGEVEIKTYGIWFSFDCLNRES